MRHIKTDFRSDLHPDSVFSFIGVHFNSVFNCCKQSDLEPSLLNKAKLCTREKNMSYKYSMALNYNHMSIFKYGIHLLICGPMMVYTEIDQKILDIVFKRQKED